ncbi:MULTISPECIES: hypothetical protein [Pseudomonas]|uniref:hypothetical protein n=1 Tax=Pseudomonas TaxID=286 RepID=UPI0003579057|nr:MULTISPECIES: hypothetical protein [Pseudomonas]EPJ82440.1 hypothetical protein CFT9_16207 [Pseudomonas sp. CFT9]MBK3450069.1 hypothetical protein [Pseudomonas haemolytica]OKP74694.1 hypothetical protein BTR19_00245 [Pseudomonas fluorescens]
MFSVVVQLYRLLGRPLIDDDRIIYSGVCTEEIRECVDKCRKLAEKYGRLIDADESEGHIDIEFDLPTSDFGRFHSTFRSFIKATPTLGKGKLPEDFYIVDENWSTTDGVEHPKYKSIKLCCDLIDGLCGLVAVVDRKSSDSYENIFFALPADDNRKPKTFVLKTEVDETILDVKLRHVSLIKALASSQDEHKIHLEERKLIFNSAIADVIESAGDDQAFPFVLKHWEDVLRKYWQNLQAYVHGFSFDKVRTELAKAELEYGAKLSGVLSDMAGKMLALPLSFGALVLLNKAVDPIEIFSIAVGVLMVTLIFCGVLWNQHLNVQRLDNSLNITFDLFDKRLSTYPGSLQRLLSKSKKEIKSQRRFLKVTLQSFLVLAVIPTLVMIGMLSYRWMPDLICFLFE